MLEAGISKIPVVDDDKHMLGIVTMKDIAHEQFSDNIDLVKTTYDNILRLVDNSEVRDVIKFLRAREIVHFQRFGEALRIIQDKLDEKNFYAFNPAFDPTNCK